MFFVSPHARDISQQIHKLKSRCFAKMAALLHTEKATRSISKYDKDQDESLKKQIILAKEDTSLQRNRECTFFYLGIFLKIGQSGLKIQKKNGSFKNFNSTLRITWTPASGDKKSQ